MSEKRREPRMDVSWPLRIAAISGRGKGNLVNVSLTGALFVTDSEVREGDLVVMRISLDADTDIDCVAQIVRTVSLGDKNAYGAEFRYVSSVDRQKLSFALLLVRDPGANGRAIRPD